MWILHCKNTTKILIGNAVNRSLKEINLKGTTFKVPTYITYISARFWAGAIVFVFKAGRSGRLFYRIPNGPR